MRDNKYTYYTRILLLLIVFSGCSVQKKMANNTAKKPFTILGFGDSITEGGPDFFSYLFPLDSMLQQAGYHAKFIGPRRSVKFNDTIFNAGYSGRNAEYLAARADSIYSIYPADMVLLHTGHNHFIEEAPVAGIIAAQRKIIRSVRKINPAATIFVASVITSGKLPKYEYIPALNVSIRSMVDSLRDPKILFVDQARRWNWEENTISDKVHPNRSGANKIAANWLEAITGFLKNN